MEEKHAIPLYKELLLKQGVGSSAQVRRRDLYWPYAARKGTGDAKSGWHPPCGKNTEPVPRWGKKIARRIASCTLDVKHSGHSYTNSDPADLIGGKTTFESVLFLPSSFFALGSIIKSNLISSSKLLVSRSRMYMYSLA